MEKYDPLSRGRDTLGVMSMFTRNPCPLDSADAVPLPFAGDDRALVAALFQGHPGAMEALYDRYASYVERVLVRVFGLDDELYDLVQDVFIEAFRAVHSIRDGQALKAWIGTLTVYTARQCIRKRNRRRVYWVKDATPHLDVPVSGVDPAAIEVLRAAYLVLDAMSADDRIVFSLRYIEGMEILELAACIGVSVSTLKRRLRRAETRFGALSARLPALQEYVLKTGKSGGYHGI